jgi:alkanesulfonate monooxygenase SsuD/methylene tetrahydromethanopterin reductase-like flavin-dependent oxidoreductase (luciferase family)
MDETGSGASRWDIHPWVGESQHTVRFGVLHGPMASWTALRDWVRSVEELGFDSFWFGDHPLLFPFDTWTVLAALSLQTKRIRLGSLVSCVYFRSPALLARMATDVDRISDGRLVLGMGIGDYPPEFEQLRLPYPPVRERQEALREAIEIVQGLWRGEPLTYDGQHFQVAEAALRSLPVQQPHVPLLIAGGGERVTLRQVAQYADVSNFGACGLTGSARDFDDVRRKYAALRGHCERFGRPYESVLRSFLCHFILAESDEAVVAKLEQHATSSPIASIEKVPGMPRVVSTCYGVPSPEPIPLQIIAGTPREMIAYCRGLVDAGARYIIVRCQNDAESLRLLGEQVMPELQSAPA